MKNTRSSPLVLVLLCLVTTINMSYGMDEPSSSKDEDQPCQTSSYIPPLSEERLSVGLQQLWKEYLYPKGANDTGENVVAVDGSFEMPVFYPPKASPMPCPDEE